MPQNINLDMVDEAIHHKKFAIVINSADELHRIGQALLTRTIDFRFHGWINKPEHQWDFYNRHPEVQSRGLAISVCLRGVHCDVNWCWPSYYADSGYTVYDFSDLDTGFIDIPDITAPMSILFE